MPLKSKKIVLTFDIEEFDLPLEYNAPVSEELQLNICSEGLQKLNDLLRAYEVQATFFTTGNYCDKNPGVIKSLSENHEIGSHAYYHSRFDEEYMLSSKSTLEKVTSKKVRGFRMPHFHKIDYEKLIHAGYEYDSSINPTFIPFRYNNLGKPRIPFKVAGKEFTEFPLSVCRVTRFPLFWLSFKNLPLSVYNYLCYSVLKHDKFLHLYFHPWEFAKLDQFRIPDYIKIPDGENYVKKFEKLLISLKKEAEFVTASDFLRNYPD